MTSYRISIYRCARCAACGKEFRDEELTSDVARAYVIQGGAGEAPGPVYLRPRLLEPGCWSDGRGVSMARELPLSGCPHCAAVHWRHALRWSYFQPRFELDPWLLAGSGAGKAVAQEPDPPLARQLSVDDYADALRALDTRAPAQGTRNAAADRYVLAREWIWHDNGKSESGIQLLAPSRDPGHGPGHTETRHGMLQVLARYAATQAASDPLFALEAAEWLREASRFEESLAFLRARFRRDPLVADLMETMSARVAAGDSAPYRLAPSDAYAAELAAHQARGVEHHDQQRERHAAEEKKKSPLQMLRILRMSARPGRESLTADQAIDAGIPDPVRTSLRSFARYGNWPLASLPHLLLAAVRLERGAPPAPHEDQLPVAANAQEAELLEFLRKILAGSTWDAWSYRPVDPPWPKFEKASSEAGSGMLRTNPSASPRRLTDFDAAAANPRKPGESN